MNNNEYPWPAPHYDLTTAEDDWGFADLGWQRLHYSLYGRIKGFRRAAEMLYDGMLAGQSTADLDTVFYPYAACWRHHVELQLKSIRAQVRALSDLPAQNQHHHDIRQLWQENRKLLRKQFPTEPKTDLGHVDRILGQLADMDPDGQAFRYASRRDERTTLPHVDRINLDAFHQAMLGVANYLDAVDTAVGEQLSTKQEVAAYYAAEFGEYGSGAP